MKQIKEEILYFEAAAMFSDVPEHISASLFFTQITQNWGFALWNTKTVLTSCGSDHLKRGTQESGHKYL